MPVVWQFRARFTVLSAAMAGAGTAATTPNTAAAIRLSPVTVLFMPLSLPARVGVTHTAPGERAGRGDHWPEAPRAAPHHHPGQTCERAAAGEAAPGAHS